MLLVSCPSQEKGPSLTYLAVKVFNIKIGECWVKIVQRLIKINWNATSEAGKSVAMCTFTNLKFLQAITKIEIHQLIPYLGHVEGE